MMNKMEGHRMQLEKHCRMKQSKYYIRIFISILCISFCISAFGINPREVPPNIIFIHVDQLSHLDLLDASGAKKIHTPGIDKLAENGLSFKQSFSTDPVCCPGRSSWWTGMWPSENGVVVNGSVAHANAPDLSRILQGGGYKTFYTGKWHVPGKDVRDLFTVLHEGSWWGEITDQEVTASARSFLRSYNDPEPFFLSVGYLNPHDICITPHIDNSRIIKGHDPAQAVLTESDDIEPEDPADFAASHTYDSREPAVLTATKRSGNKYPFYPDWSLDMWHLHLYNYLRFIEMVDIEIELLIQELERSPWRDNTLVIFTSDHGEGMGRHQYAGKGTLYEESVKVPLIIATMGDSLNIPKNELDEKHLVSGIDFARTVCDYAGIKSSAIAHGRSLRPLVEAELVEEMVLEDWREYVYAETMLYMKMIRGQKYKYIREYIEDEIVMGVPPSYKTHSTGVEQLFDLIKDPNEQHNLAYNVEYQDILKDLREVMNGKEDERVPLKEITHPRGRNYMHNVSGQIRKLNIPVSYRVK